MMQLTHLTAEPAPLSAEELEAHVQCRMSGRVRGLQVIRRNRGLVLQGHALTYYAKQLAQQAVMEASDLPILANEIDVS